MHTAAGLPRNGWSVNASTTVIGMPMVFLPVVCCSPWLSVTWRRWSQAGSRGLNGCLGENPATSRVALQRPHGNNDLAFDRSVDMGKTFPAAGILISKRVDQPTRVDAQDQELGLVRVKAVRRPSDLVGVGAMDEAFRREGFC